MSKSESLAVLGAYAVHLATGAAELIRRMDRRSADGAGSGATAFLDVHTKSTATDLVTAVDRASEQWLVDQILRDRPGDAVLGEEGGGRDGTSGVRWVLDPIDGTVNFVLGLPEYTVSVAAERDGQFVAGAVCAPATGELFQAVLGGGAWRGAQRLHGPREVELAQAVIGTGFGYDRDLRARQGSVAARLLPRVADIRRIGSAALDLCGVACGRLDGYYEVGLHPWDHGAGALIATEAGCRATGLRGRPVSLEMAAVAGAGLAPDFFGLLEELDADRVSD